MPDRQSVLAPMGPAAERIADHWWLMLALATAVGLVVLALLAYALFRRREEAVEWRPFPRPSTERPDEAPPPGPVHPEPDRALRTPTSGADRRTTRWIVVGGLVAPILILTPLFVFTLLTLRALASPPNADVVIDVTGVQWWWEVTYSDSTPAARVVTANEIHVPVGRRVELRLRSPDVIHSFWVPELQGKIDLVPGRTNVTWIQADEPGVYRGQCAEYCGLQHTRMALLVIAEPQVDFDSWLAAQRAPAAAPSNRTVARGRDVFETTACALCHTIRGTRARGTPGPDLTHLASRRTLAAVTLPNDRASLRGWIANPQALKPGTQMPAVPLSAPDLEAVASYLETLR